MTKRLSLSLNTSNSLLKFQLSKAEELFIEAEIGEIQGLYLLDGAVMEMVFDNGVIRMDVALDKLIKQLGGVSIDPWGKPHRP